MSKRLTPFFATQGDLVTIAQDAIAVRPVRFVHAGLFTEPTLEILVDINALRELKTYLVVDHGVSVNLRAVSQRAGGQMYAVDQLDNPNTITLHTGGKHSDHQLIAGQLGTIGNSQQSDDLYALFARIIRKRFEKVKSYYVGPEAIAMLDGGARLSATPKSPRTYDLVR